MTRLRKFLLLSLIIFFTIKDTDQETIKTKVIITVFIHGAINLGPLAPVTHFDLFMFDKIPGSLYEKIILSIREDSFFYENQTIQTKGLHEIDFQDIQAGQAAKAFACIFDTLRKKNNNKKIRRYYTFGWDGTFSKTKRKEHAKKLYEALLIECAELEKNGFKPVVEIIGYCHGGQLTLELANVVKDYSTNKEDIPLAIQKSIFIGMPISPDADSCIASPVFKKVFIIFSEHDRVQPIDLFVSGQLWNGRTVETNDPLIQKKLFHIELQIHEQMRKKTENQNFFNITNRMSWRNRSPGHIELWFFDWVPNNYRKEWILKPFPATVFLPIILQYTKEEYINFSRNVPLIIDIRPDIQKVLIRQKNNSFIREKPWITKQLLSDLQKIATKAAPTKRKTKKEYKERINHHIMKLQRTEEETSKF